MAILRGILSGLAVSLVSFMLTLAVLEAALRTGAFTPTVYRSTRLETHLSASLQKPNFRQPGFELREKGEAFRIVVVGDSFAWGDGVHPEDSYPLRLQTRLAAVSRGDVFEVVNWSRPGWNTVRQVRSLGMALSELDPDLLLLGFVLNDSEPIEQERVRALLAPAERRKPAAGASEWLYRYSRLYSLVWTRLESGRQQRELSAYYRGLFQGETWEACRRALRKLRNLARKQSFPLVLVIFPVFDGPMDDSYRYADLHAQTRAAAERLKIPVLDLFETYRGVEARRLAVTPFTNPHPNELAHRLAADAILDYLVRARLLPRVNHKPNRRRKTL